MELEKGLGWGTHQFARVVKLGSMASERAPGAGEDFSVCSGSGCSQEELRELVNHELQGVQGIYLPQPPMAGGLCPIGRQHPSEWNSHWLG